MNRFTSFIRKFLLALPFSAFVLTICLFFLTYTSYAGELVLHFLSVGHGDAIFIEFPNGGSMLVDGGNREAGNKVLNYIEDLGYTKIDYMVLTHHHADHLGGLINVLENLDVSEVWTCPYYNPRDSLWMAFDALLETKKPYVKILGRGNLLQFGQVQGEVLHPPLGSSLEALRGDNGASVAIKLELGNTSVLLAADIDQDTDQDLVELFGEKLSSTVLKCPHHGSRSSNSEKFLETVSPQIAIVSTGPSEWGYPDSETIERIEQYAQEVYRTDMEGDIILSLDGEEATVKLP